MNNDPVCWGGGILGSPGNGLFRLTGVSMCEFEEMREGEGKSHGEDEERQ